jgi:hypothetical protein
VQEHASLLGLVPASDALPASSVRDTRPRAFPLSLYQLGVSRNACSWPVEFLPLATIWPLSPQRRFTPLREFSAAICVRHLLTAVRLMSVSPPADRTSGYWCCGRGDEGVPRLTGRPLLKRPHVAVGVTEI